MNKIIAGLFATALVASVSAVRADVGTAKPADKDLKKIVEEGPYVETARKGIKLSGYVDAGYIYNFVGRGDTAAAAPGGAIVGNPRVATDRVARGNFELNAVKIAIEKPLTDANELQAGFRVDAMLGQDASWLGTNASAATNGSDSLFLEQAYVQFRLPYGNGIDFKVGKFVTILGYEVIERPVNMNITYGNIFANEIPLWHTGVLAKYQWNDIVTTQFGVVNGANVDNGVGAGGTAKLTGSDDNGALVASVDLKVPGGNANWYNAVYYSVNSDVGYPAGTAATIDNRPTVDYDTWMNWMPKFANDKLLLGVNFNLGNAPLVALGTGAESSTTWYGSALYAKYQFTDIFSLATRLDYIHNDNSQAFGNGAGSAALTAGSREDLWSATLTAGFDVIENMQLRAEYRADFGKDLNVSTSSGAAKNGTTDGPTHTVSAEVVYSF
jgi:hypothetical protein